MLNDMALGHGPDPRIDERDQFIEYLTQTLIPDLRESGRDATADDFETCVRYMQ
jgi:hypothetical protein